MLSADETDDGEDKAESAVVEHDGYDTRREMRNMVAALELRKRLSIQRQTRKPLIAEADQCTLQASKTDPNELSFSISDVEDDDDWNEQHKRSVAALTQLPQLAGICLNLSHSAVEVTAEIGPDVSFFHLDHAHHGQECSPAHPPPPSSMSYYFDGCDCAPGSSIPGQKLNHVRAKRTGYAFDVRQINRAHGQFTERVCNLVGRYLLANGHLHDDMFMENQSRFDEATFSHSYPNMQVQYETISLREAWENCESDPSLGYLDRVDVCNRFFPDNSERALRVRKNSVKRCVIIHRAFGLSTAFFVDICRSMKLPNPYVASSNDSDGSIRLYMATNADAFRLLKHLQHKFPNLECRLTRCQQTRIS